jgi:hypothetical protein
MNCFNHPTITAVAVCKNCSKGLCPDCLTEVENGIACTATCIEEVKLVNALIHKNKRATERVAGSYYRTTFIYFAMALLFFYAAFAYADLKLYGAIAGAIFMIGGFLTLYTASKYKKS